MPKFRKPGPNGIDAIGQYIVFWRQQTFWAPIIIIIIIIIIIWSDLASYAAAFTTDYISGERDLPIFRASGDEPKTELKATRLLLMMLSKFK